MPVPLNICVSLYIYSYFIHIQQPQEFSYWVCCYNFKRHLLLASLQV